MTRKRILEILLCTCLLLPTFLLNIKNYTDWGDDFAMYINEAKLIITGKDINAHHYINNPTTGTYSPSAYPIGYPLLIAPVLKKYGIDFEMLFYYQTIFYVLFGVFLFLLLRKYFSFIVALLATLLVCFNPYLLNAKAELLSDIPFATFFYFSILGIHYFEKQQNEKMNFKRIALLIIFSLTLAFSMHIRSAGSIIFLSYVLYFLLNLKWGKNSTIKISLIGYHFILTIIFYTVIKIIFPIHAFYNSFITIELIYSNLIIHLTYYAEVLFGFLKFFDVKEYGFITLLSACFFIISIFIGFIVEIKKKTFGLYVILFLTYFIIICMSNLSNNGFRLILPLIFFFVYFSIIGFKNVMPIITSQYKIVGIASSLLMLFLYRIDVVKMIHPVKNYSAPTDEIYQPVFNYLQKNCTEKDTLAAAYPRAMALFTPSCYFHTSEKIQPDNLMQELKKFHAKYYVTFEGTTEQEILDYIKKDTFHFEKKIKGGEMDVFYFKNNEID
jgi:hypothetical protein